MHRASGPMLSALCWPRTLTTCALRHIFTCLALTSADVYWSQTRLGKNEEADRLYLIKCLWPETFNPPGWQHQTTRREFWNPIACTGGFHAQMACGRLRSHYMPFTRHIVWPKTPEAWNSDLEFRISDSKITLFSQMPSDNSCLVVWSDNTIRY